MRLSNSFGVALVLTATIASSSFGGPNLIVNGTFEDGLNSWQLGNGFNFSTNVASTSTDTPSGTGNSADLEINPVVPNDPNQSVDGLPWLIQDVPVIAGDSLIFTASVREVRQFIPPNTNSNYPEGIDAWITAQVWFLPNSESGTILAYGFQTFTNPTWETMSFDKNSTGDPLVVPASATIARVLFTPQNPDFGVGTGRYRIDDVSLSTKTASLPGDFNSDGSVNGIDFAAWQNGFGVGTTLQAGDADGDGDVDGGDFLIWQRNLTIVGVAPTMVAVPEPSSILLLLLATVPLLTYLQRH